MPHASTIKPIWEAIVESDLIVWAYPVYVWHAPGHVKALFDHFGSRWMVHRPEPKLFNKTAAIITQSIGAPNHSAQADVGISLTWLGIPRVKKLGFTLQEGVIWDELSEKRRDKMIQKTKAFARSFKSLKPAKMSLLGHIIFAACRSTHQKQLKKTGKPSADAQYWIDQGWIKGS